jgi:hypothetical protein
MTERDREGGKLSEYRARRRPGRSGEPSGSRRAGSRAAAPRFVVQRHDASSLHFDFRLEIEDVLVSWAVPKGPSTDPSGEYGAGTVVVWDIGTYRNPADDDVSAGLARGHLKVWLEGEKLRGGYALTRTKMRGDPRNWLLVKVDDERADRRRRPARTQPESVLSGRTNEDL